MKIKLFIVGLVLNSILFAQVNFNAPPPPVVTGVSATVLSGRADINVYYYWVVAVYPIGRSTVSLPILLRNVPSVGSVKISWNPQSVATGYDVLRTITATAPSTGCGCALVVNQAAATVSFTDNLGATIAYSVTNFVTSKQVTEVLDNLNNAALSIIDLPTVDHIFQNVTINGTCTGAGCAGLTPAAADTVLTNATAGVAVPLPFVMPVCIPPSVSLYDTGTHAWECASSGSSTANQLLDFSCVRTSATLVTCTFPTGSTNFGSGNFTQAQSTTVTITLTTGAAVATTFSVYYDPNTPAIKVDTSGADFTGVATVGATNSSTGVTPGVYPVDTIPLARLTGGNTIASNWDAFSSCLPSNASGCIDDRSIYRISIVKPAAGNCITSSVDSHGIKTLDGTNCAKPNIVISATPTVISPSTYAICTGVCTVTVPTPAAGFQFCITDDDAVTNAITINNPGGGVFFGKTDRSGYGTATTGTMVSTAGTNSYVCLVGRDALHYTVASFAGTWTVN